MIYLDSAATTLKKPVAVARAASNAIRTMTTPGRGGHPPATAAAETAFACREEAAALFGLDDPAKVIFTFNATHALNLAIHAAVHPGDTVLISGYEHNAVTRPLHMIPNIKVKIARSPLFNQEAILDQFDRLMTKDVSAVITTHVSNVFGYILPVEKIAQLCNQRGIPLIVDASQSAGAIPVSMKELNAAFIAMPGHKGLYGPQGTGLLLCGSYPTVPLMAGGTGSNSKLQEMPDFLPDRLEAGTHNIPGIAGLLEGLRFVRKRGPGKIHDHETALISQMARGLAKISGVEVFQSLDPAAQAGVLSFRKDGWDCESLGEALAERGAAVRAGLHCAPLAHETAGTLDTGTVRASVSAFTTSNEVAHFLQLMRELHS